MKNFIVFILNILLIGSFLADLPASESYLFPKSLFKTQDNRISLKRVKEISKPIKTIQKESVLKAIGNKIAAIRMPSIFRQQYFNFDVCGIVFGQCERGHDRKKYYA